MTEGLRDDLDAFILATIIAEFKRGTAQAETLKLINRLLQKRVRASRNVMPQSLAG